MRTLSDGEARSSFNILVVDDEQIALNLMLRIVRKEGYQVTGVSDGAEALKLIAERNFDVVLTDLVLGPVDGIQLLSEARRRDPETEVIIITAFGSVDRAIEATRKGAFHYLQKPIRPDELRSILRQASDKRGLARQVRELQDQLGLDLPLIVGNSPKIRRIKELIRQIEGSCSNVLITGESGTGKELVARAIHQTSKRKSGRFVAFNCASLTDELLANELFGHEKEAYTGAGQARAGLLESAHGGTVFFDEVGDMSPAMQAKILRVVQEKELLRVGSTLPIPVDIRVIAATNKDLKQLCAAGIFRQDLFFRLNVISIQMPNLSERREDIPLLAAFFLRRYAERAGKRLLGFSNEVMAIVASYGFPGNVRELENIVERAVSLASGERIEIADLPPDLKEFTSYTFHRERERLLPLEEMEREYIRWVLDQTGNNKSEAARILGIDRVSLYRKLKRYEFEE